MPYLILDRPPSLATALCNPPVDPARVADNEGAALPQSIVRDSVRYPTVLIILSTAGNWWCLRLIFL